MLLRMYEPMSGDIFYGFDSIRNINLEKLRDVIGYVG
jgi:ABC-type multidrug transport system fused ATPase/permease subunit